MSPQQHQQEGLGKGLRRVGTIRLGELPYNLQDSIRKYISWFSTGLIGVSETNDGENAELIGSGTLIKFNELFGILTAGHVIGKGLKEKSNNFVSLGLTLVEYAHRFVIPVSDLKYIELYKEGGKGSDIGVIIIPEYAVAKIESLKNFWNINKYRNLVLNSMRGSANYAAALAGWPNENTKEIIPESGFHRTISFGGISGLTGIDREWEKGAFDFIEVSVSYDEASDSPLDLRGMSGGGFWKITIEKFSDGTISHKDPFLAGLVFWQGPKIQGLRSIFCHGPKSIYEEIYHKLGDFEASLR